MSRHQWGYVLGLINHIFTIWKALWISQWPQTFSGPEWAMLINISEDNSVQCWWSQSSFCQQRPCSSDFGGALLSLGHCRGFIPSSFSPLLDPGTSLDTTQLIVQQEAIQTQPLEEESQQTPPFTLKLISTHPAWAGPHQGPNFVQ